MNLFDRVVRDIEMNRDRRIEGKYNCIPWGLPRFEEELPGIEQGCYTIITGSTKSGKSQLTDHLFMFSPLDFISAHPDCGMDVKILYFSLEMSKESKIRKTMARRLYRISNKAIRVTTKELQSKKGIINPDYVNRIIEDSVYYNSLLDKVTFIDDIRNPYGIFRIIDNYAKKHGTIHYKEVNIGGENTKVFDWYEPHNPEQYVIIIIDHVSLISKEKSHPSLWHAINDLSQRYLVTARNRYNYSVVLIQQQAADKESMESIKLNRMHPTLDALADNKATARDADIIMGIYSPFRHRVREYEGYDITKFKDHIRFLEIIAGRDGGGNTISPLFFDGAVSHFSELPLPNDLGKIKKITDYINTIT